MADQIPYPLVPPEETPAQSPQLTVLQKVEFIRRAEIFSRANVEELFRVASIAREVQFKAGETIFREDEIVDALFLVVKGKVELASREKGLGGHAGSGDAFAIYSVLTREPSAVTATAQEETFALLIGAEDFYLLLSQDMEIVVSIFKYFVGKARLDRVF